MVVPDLHIFSRKKERAAVILIAETPKLFNLYLYNCRWAGTSKASKPN